MKRERKLGEMAVITGYEEPTPAIWIDGCGGNHRSGPHWHYLAPSTWGQTWTSDDYVQSRPLAVIDPEDFQSLLSIVQAMGVHRAGEVITGTAERLQAALREFADPKPPKPPKPAEPAGLGAVVEDKRGFKFVRVAESFDGWAKDRDWQRIGGEINSVRNFGWKDVDAVIVLSEGVQS